MCNCRADGDSSRDIADSFIDLLHKSYTDRNQNNKCNIKEYRDGEDKRRKRNRIHRFRLRENLYHAVRDNIGSAGVADHLPKDDSEPDRETDTGEHITESIINYTYKS